MRVTAIPAGLVSESAAATGVVAVVAAAAGDAGVDHDPFDRFDHGIRAAPPGPGGKFVAGRALARRLD